MEGGGIPTIPITVDGTNDSVQFEVDGFSFSITLAHGTYDDEAALASAVSSAIQNDSQAAAVASASLTANDTIALRTVAEGSDHSLTVTGGTALAALGFTRRGHRRRRRRHRRRERHDHHHHRCHRRGPGHPAQRRRRHHHGPSCRARSRRERPP